MFEITKVSYLLAHCIFVLSAFQIDSYHEFSTQFRVRTKRSLSQNQIITAIKAEAQSISKNRFKGDVEFTQSVDRVNKITQYKAPDSTDEFTFERSQSDAKQEVVVLFGGEDNLPKNASNTGYKETFVVLRKKPKSKSKYYGSYVYLRFVAHYTFISTWLRFPSITKMYCYCVISAKKVHHVKHFLLKVSIILLV